MFSRGFVAVLLSSLDNFILVILDQLTKIDTLVFWLPDPLLFIFFTGSSTTPFDSMEFQRTKSKTEILRVHRKLSFFYTLKQTQVQHCLVLWDYRTEGLHGIRKSCFDTTEPPFSNLLTILNLIRVPEKLHACSNMLNSLAILPIVLWFLFWIMRPKPL